MTAKNKLEVGKKKDGEDDRFLYWSFTICATCVAAEQKEK